MKNELMIFESKDQAVVSSRTISDRFEKMHKNLLRDIQNLAAQNCAAKSMFYKSFYKDRGKDYPEYLMNRDGFSLLVMGFTGKDALEWKIKYTQAFNAMEAIIKERQSSEWLMTRKQGKLVRRNETDALASLANYAEAQGSSNMRKQVYNIYSKLVNQLMGIDAGMRDRIPFKTLTTIMFLEDMILHTVDEEMQKGSHYKDIFKMCKANGEQIIKFA